MDRPLVSIIIPVYNAEKHIAETITSALNQTWPNKEIILVNDGSTDKSVDIINNFKSDEIVLINQANQGASAAKQTGLEHACGEYIQYLDADDILATTKIEKQAFSLLDKPDKVAACRTASFFNEDYANDNLPEDEHFFIEYLNEPLNFLIRLYGGYDMRGGMIQPNAFFTPKNIIEKAGPWNKTISPCTDEDGEYFCRVILNSKGIIYQPEVLNYYRKSIKKNSLSGLTNETTYSNLVESTWLKHLHLLSFAMSDSQITNIHNATNLTLELIKVRAYPAFNALNTRIVTYQSKLSPSLKLTDHRLGGRAIDYIANTFGWRTARQLQYYYAQLFRNS